MRLLLDTHTMLWWLFGDRRLSLRAKAAIADESHVVLVSAASAWEITTKHRIGKLPQADVVAVDVERAVRGQGFQVLEISMHHAEHAGRLHSDHRDPFDRMLAAQASLEGLLVVSNDRVFDDLGVTRLW